jgi:hypothetical protein
LITGGDPDARAPEEGSGPPPAASGPGVAETRDDLVPDVVRYAARPGLRSFVLQGEARGRDGPALAVDGEAQFGVIRLAIAEFGAGFGGRRTVGAPGAGRKLGLGLGTVVRGLILMRVLASQDVHLEYDSDWVRSYRQLSAFSGTSTTKHGTKLIRYHL